MTTKFEGDKINPHRSLADKIKANLVTGSKITEKEKNEVFFSELPEGLDKEKAEALLKYNGDFVTAAHIAAGELAADAFINDKDLSKIRATIGMGLKNSVELTISREKTQPNNFAKEGQQPSTIVTPLHIRSTTVISSRGLDGVRSEMSALFAGKI